MLCPNWVTNLMSRTNSNQRPLRQIDSFAKASIYKDPLENGIKVHLHFSAQRQSRKMALGLDLITFGSQPNAPL